MSARVHLKLSVATGGDDDDDDEDEDDEEKGMPAGGEAASPVEATLEGAKVATIPLLVL